MEVENTSKNVFKSFRISWTVYVRVIVVFAIKIAILFGLYYFAMHVLQSEFAIPVNIINIIAISLLAVGLIFFTINILTLRSIVLYTNEDGVWVYRGIFPWSRGASGVKWRDLDSASYITKFSSWLLQTYTIKVEHRFTKDNEIVLNSVYKGQNAAMHINELHKEFVSNAQE
ncbi:MAG: hypothetical protein LBS73_03640 [Campylobacteraceae bacterium]|jgi:hypothetical protein|nr:hypothetical protein [Campylobacteraceae bacterium]